MDHLGEHYDVETCCIAVGSFLSQSAVCLFVYDIRCMRLYVPCVLVLLWLTCKYFLFYFLKVYWTTLYVAVL